MSHFWLHCEKRTLEKFSLVADKTNQRCPVKLQRRYLGWEVKGSGLSSTWHAQRLTKCATCTEWTYIAYTVLDMFTLAWLLICHGPSAGQRLVHTYIICPRIKFGNICGLSLYLRKIVCRRAVSTGCLRGWKTTDKVCTSGRFRV